MGRQSRTCRNVSLLDLFSGIRIYDVKAEAKKQTLLL